MDALARSVVNEFDGFHDRSDLTDLFAVEPALGSPWMIVLDGMDEVLDYKDRKRLLDTIAYRWEDPQYRFLVTSRTLSPFELYPLERVNVPVFEIQQFSEDELPHFAERWFRAFGASDAPNLSSRLISQLEHNRLVQLACNPLIMTMACAIIASGSEGALPHSRADLYEKFVTLLMSKAADQLHELRRLQDRLTSYGRQSQDAIEELLADNRHLIERLASDRMGTPVQESLISHAEALASLMRPENVPLPASHGIIQNVPRQTGVVVERGDDFAFVHQTIIEYLAACQSASQELSRREAWRLRLAAGRGDSRALFTASIMHGKGASLIGKTPRILSIRRLVHARLVASLAYEGLELPDKTVDVAREQLADFAALRRNCIPFIVREYVWDDYEDDCVLAAKSLMLLDKGGGLIALAHAAVDPSVGGFNIYSYNQMLGLDREQGMVILARLASSSEMESSDRVAVARLILGENRELGLEVIEAVALDRAVEGVFRSEMGFEMLGVDRSRGVRVLARLVADPLMEQYRI